MHKSKLTDNWLTTGVHQMLVYTKAKSTPANEKSSLICSEEIW